MTRRDLMRVALGLAAVPVAAKAASAGVSRPAESLGKMGDAHRVETPLTAVHPYCPTCGMAVMFMRREAYPNEVLPVRCGVCGWEGQSPRAVPIRGETSAEALAFDRGYRHAMAQRRQVPELWGDSMEYRTFAAQEARNRLESTILELPTQHVDYWTERIAEIYR